MSLNPRQRAFADEYIISGNAEQAAIKAGYSENYARGQSYKLLAIVGIKEYIQKRIEELHGPKIMSQEQVLEELTKIALRKTSKGYYKSREEVNGETVETLKEYEHTPSIEEQTKALELLGKRYALFTDKKEVDMKNTDITIKIGEYDGD